MSHERTTTRGKGTALTPRQLDRILEAVRASEVVKALPNTAAPRPADTYGKLRDDRSEQRRLTSQGQ